MRRILIAAVLLGSLVQAGVASAGCNATVGLAPPPQGIGPGTTWTAEMTVLQHGVTPLPNADTARPTLTIVNDETGATRTFTSRSTGDPAVFAADVVFPAAGSWRYEVYDDFTAWEDDTAAPCAQTHEFAAVTVGGAPASGGGTPPAPTQLAAATNGGGFPVWPVVGAALAALAAVALSAAVLRRRRGTRGRGGGALDGDPPHQARAERAAARRRARRRAPTSSTRRGRRRGAATRRRRRTERGLLEAERRPGAAPARQFGRRGEGEPVPGLGEGARRDEGGQEERERRRGEHRAHRDRDGEGERRASAAARSARRRGPTSARPRSSASRRSAA